MGNSLRGQKNYATPTNEDLGQTSNWSKLVAAYLPVARLVLDRLVPLGLQGVRIDFFPVKMISAEHSGDNGIIKLPNKPQIGMVIF